MTVVAWVFLQILRVRGYVYTDTFVQTAKRYLIPFEQASEKPQQGVEPAARCGREETGR